MQTGTELPHRPISSPSHKSLSPHTQPECCLHTGVAASTYTAALYTSPLDIRPYTCTHCTTCRHLPSYMHFCRLTLTSLFIGIPACLHTDGDTLMQVHTHSHFYSILPAICTLTLSMQPVMHISGSFAVHAPVNVHSVSTSTP